MKFSGYCKVFASLLFILPTLCMTQNKVLAEAAATVASVTINGTTTQYEDFDEAVEAWNTAGDGAVLTLLSDIFSDTIHQNTNSSYTVMGATKGTEAEPMVLDLNGYGSIYNGANDSDIILVKEGACLQMTDSGAGTGRYVLTSGGRGTGVSAEQPEGDFAEVDGGFIAGADSSYATVVNYGSLTMSGGSICSNKGMFSGGVYNEGLFTMTGGTISGNAGGGVYIGDGTLTLAGTPVITDNLVKTNGGTQTQNIYLKAGKTIKADNLTGGKAGVSMQTPGVFTEDAQFEERKDAAGIFTSDDSGYCVMVNEDRQALLEAVPEQYISVTGVSGSFQDMIRLNFYFKNPQGLDLSGSYVKLSGGEDDRIVQIDFDEAAQDGDGAYIFSIPLYANEGRDMITANVYDASGSSIAVKGSSGAYYFENELQYSLNNYFTVLENSGKTDTTKALGAAAKDYCSAAQIYFKYSDYAEAVISDKINAVTEDTLAAYTSKRNGTKPAELTVKGISAMIEASVLTYARSCVRSSNPDLQNLGKAMYLYNQAANAAFEG